MAVLFSGAGFAAPATVLDANAVTNQSVRSAAGSKRTVEQRLTRIENILNVRLKMQLEVQERLDLLSVELRNLQGSIDENALELNKITLRQRDIMNDIERMRVSNFVKPQTTPSADLGITSETATTAVNLTGKDSYNHAIKLIKNERKYDEAIPALQSFLATYPESDLAPNAHYWLGLLLRKNNNNTAAKVEFETVVSKYPNSAKRADSLQKLGMIAKLSGKKSEAARYFELVIKEYPNDSVAKLAKQQLSQLK